jgi:hypothetical protein
MSLREIRALLDAASAADAWGPANEPHEIWAKRRILEAQRRRRSRERRIDYYASPEADVIIDSLRRPAAGGDASSILNHIVTEWAAGRGRPRPRFRNKIETK